jgi:hypothetical protein
MNSSKECKCSPAPEEPAVLSPTARKVILHRSSDRRGLIYEHVLSLALCRLDFLERERLVIDDLLREFEGENLKEKVLDSLEFDEVTRNQLDCARWQVETLRGQRDAARKELEKVVEKLKDASGPTAPASHLTASTDGTALSAGSGGCTVSSSTGGTIPAGWRVIHPDHELHEGDHVIMGGKLYPVLDVKAVTTSRHRFASTYLRRIEVASIPCSDTSYYPYPPVGYRPLKKGEIFGLDDISFTHDYDASPRSFEVKWHHPDTWDLKHRVGRLQGENSSPAARKID